MDLRNLEVAVDEERNSTTLGDARNAARPREEASCYLLVGGSNDVYSVTMNYTEEAGKGGHFCKIAHSGKPCPGNTFSLKKTHGAANQRDVHNPAQWCKHIKAAFAAPEMIAEAQDITARAFGRTATVTIKEPVPAFETVKAEPTARERLAEIEAEADALRETLKAEKAGELRDAVAALLETHEWDDIIEALNAAA